jgi:hypothetical protein
MTNALIADLEEIQQTVLDEVFCGVGFGINNLLTHKFNFSIIFALIL